MTYEGIIDRGSVLPGVRRGLAADPSSERVAQPAIRTKSSSLHVAGVPSAHAPRAEAIMCASDPVAEAEWKVTAVEARILLAMRDRAAGRWIDDAAIVRMFEQLEAAIYRLRELKKSTASTSSNPRLKQA